MFNSNFTYIFNCMECAFTNSLNGNLLEHVGKHCTKKIIFVTFVNTFLEKQNLTVHIRRMHYSISIEKLNHWRNQKTIYWEEIPVLDAYFFRLLKKNGIPFPPEWNDHSIPFEMRASIPTGMEWLHYIQVRMEWPSHSRRNGMFIAARMEW